MCVVYRIKRPDGRSVLIKTDSISVSETSSGLSCVVRSVAVQDNPGELGGEDYTNGTKGGPIENYGTLVFEKTATFADNTDVRHPLMCDTVQTLEIISSIACILETFVSS